MPTEPHESTTLNVNHSSCPIEHALHKPRAHGHARRRFWSPEYVVWRSMKARCLNPKHPHYADYGGRGITVCPEWINNFENFLADMGRRRAGTTLDRIDNDGPYA